MADFPQRRSVHPILGFIVLGNHITQVGIFWIGFILALTRWWGLALNPIQLAPSSFSRETAVGVIVSVRTEGASGTEEMWTGNAIKKYTYSFTTATGAPHLGAYHSDGGAFVVGDKVPIEYLTAYPGVSRIIGLAPAHSTENVMTVIGVMILFQGAGIILLASGLRMGLRHLFLLRHGELSIGKLISKEMIRVGAEDGYGRVRFDYKLTYDCRTDYGETREVNFRRPAGIAKADTGGSGFDIDAPEEAYVLIHPREPRRSVLAREVYGYPQFDRTGTVYSSRPYLVFAYLIVPIVVIAGHVLWAFL